MFRYDSFGDDPPICTAESAARTCGASRSASEYTAIVRRPMRRAVRMIAQGDLPPVGDED